MDVSEKPIGLILLDLIFWIIPEIEIFGETVRDLLSCEQISILNLQTRDVNTRLFSKKLRKFRDNIEIHGYILKVEAAEHYHQSWHVFEDNFIRHGMTAAIIQRIGSFEDQIRVMLITSDKLTKYHPAFLCNMLKMTSDGHLSVLDMSKLMGSGYLDHYRLASGRMLLLQEILSNIYEHKITPIISPIKIGSGYEDRFRRSEIIYMLIELMERGWIPSFTIADCGFNLSIHKIESMDVKFEYPRIRKLYRKVMLNDDDINVTTDNNADDDSEEDIDEEKKQKEEKDLCAICQDVLSIGSVLKLHCTHMFHNYCIYQHFHKIGSNSDLCPICRTLVVQESPQPRRAEDPDTTDTDSDDDETSDSTDVDEGNPSTNILQQGGGGVGGPPPPPPPQQTAHNLLQQLQQLQQIRNSIANRELHVASAESVGSGSGRVAPPPPVGPNPHVNNDISEDSDEVDTVDLERIIFDYESDQLNGMASADGED